MKNALATVTLAALLSTGAASASAMPVAAPAADSAANVSVELVGHRGHKFRHGRQRILPQHVVVRSLHHRGFRNIRNVRFVRGDYVMRARGYRGPVRLVVDGRTARILSRQPLDRGRHRPGFSFHGRNGGFSYSFGMR